MSYRMKIQLTNDFHKTSTSAFCLVSPTAKWSSETLSRRQVDRIREDLCGVSGCRCEGISLLGDWEWTADGGLVRYGPGFNELP